MAPYREGGGAQARVRLGRMGLHEGPPFGAVLKLGGRPVRVIFVVVGRGSTASHVRFAPKATGRYGNTYPPLWANNDYWSYRLGTSLPAMDKCRSALLQRSLHLVQARVGALLVLAGRACNADAADHVIAELDRHAAVE